MNSTTFFKHVRETTFTKAYTLCGKVVQGKHYLDLNGEDQYYYELHIGVHVFQGEEDFTKKVGKYQSHGNAILDPINVVQLVDNFGLHEFLDFAKILVPRKAIKKSITVLTKIS